MMYHHIIKSVSQPQLSPKPPAAWRLYCTRGSSAKWLNNYGCKALETKIYWSPSSYERDRTRKVTAVVCTCATSLINWNIPTKYGYMRICQYRTCETVVRYMCLSENRVSDKLMMNHYFPQNELPMVIRTIFRHHQMIWKPQFKKNVLFILQFHAACAKHPFGLSCHTFLCAQHGVTIPAQ